MSYPGAGRDDERLHAGAGVVALLLAEAGVDDVDDAVYGQRGFCDVGGHHHLGARRERERGGWRRIHSWNKDHSSQLGEYGRKLDHESIKTHSLKFLLQNRSVIYLKR